MISCLSKDGGKFTSLRAKKNLRISFGKLSHEKKWGNTQGKEKFLDLKKNFLTSERVGSTTTKLDYSYSDVSTYNSGQTDNIGLPARRGSFPGEEPSLAGRTLVQ